MTSRDRWALDDVLEASQKPEYPEIEVRPGMTLTHTGSATTGSVAGFSQGDQVVLLDRFGARQFFKPFDGAFTHLGVRVALRAPKEPAETPMRITASGSVDAGRARAHVAKASRIWVEGIHDAELVEKIWGDDLRAAAIVVEPMHGADDLATAVAEFGPSSGRRLGILLDHLVAGSKESRIAGDVSRPAVLVCGHPYVDIWAAIRPETVGIAAWPDVPFGRPWKQGVLEALGVTTEPGPFWGKVLDAVGSYRDVETPLVNAVEQLIDFVTAE